MPVSSTHPEARGFAFIPTVISSIGTAAGVLILAASFLSDSGADQSSVFAGVRWIALALTLLCGTILFASLRQFAGKRAFQGKFVTILAVLAAVALIAMLVRTTLI